MAGERMVPRLRCYNRKPERNFLFFFISQNNFVSRLRLYERQGVCARGQTAPGAR